MLANLFHTSITGQAIDLDIEIVRNFTINIIVSLILPRKIQYMYIYVVYGMAYL